VPIIKINLYGKEFSLILIVLISKRFLHFSQRLHDEMIDEKIYVC